MSLGFVARRSLPRAKRTEKVSFTSKSNVKSLGTSQANKLNKKGNNKAQAAAVGVRNHCGV